MSLKTVNDVVLFNSYELNSPGLGFPAGFFIDEEKNHEEIQREAGWRIFP